jgi:glycosyltransferase 2 family protein
VKVHRSLRRVAAGVFVVLALAFFAYTLADAWNETNGRLPSVARLGGAALLVALGLVAAAVAWVSLLESGNRLDHGASLLLSQLGKYVPGAIWQAAGLVSLARSVGVRVGRSVTAFTVMALTQAVAGCTFALLLAFVWSSVAILPRVFLGLGGVAAVALLDRRWMVKLLHAVPRTRNAALDVVPSQIAILRACLASVVTLAATSAAYLMLIGSFGALHHPVLVFAAYAVAWTIGFLAVPIPSGVGIREAVLVGILHGVFPTSVIVAASVYQRLVSVAIEGFLAAIASQRLRPARLAAARAVSDEDASSPRVQR